MLNTPFSPWPSFSSEEVEAVAQVLRSNKVNYWTGDEGRQFEKEFAEWSGCSYAVAVSNGTLALDLCLRALGVGPGDEVLVTSRSFMASASCIVTAGAVPVFVDVDRDSQNLTAETCRAAITPRTRAIICVHLAGWPCDMDPIMALAAEHDLWVIEDCAQAHGAIYRGRPVGSIGHINAWSFCQDKVMTTGGEGGMVTTNNRDLWRKAWEYKDHGKSYSAVYDRNHPPGFRWLHESFGTNWRMLEIQAVIGRLQLKYMPDWHAQRKSNAIKILETARTIPSLRAPIPASDSTHAWYRCYVFVRPERLAAGWTRDRIVEQCNEMGVPSYQGACSEMYREKAFVEAGYQPDQPLPVAVELGGTSLMFLVHPTLTEDEIQKTCDVLKIVMNRATHSDFHQTKLDLQPMPSG